MKFINKGNTENRIKGLTLCRRIIDSCWDGNQYVNLQYDQVDKTHLAHHLVNEQSGYCCYCMRRLYLEEYGLHSRNVTLEHVIPNKIKQEEWVRDRVRYRKLPILGNRNVIVCPDGKVEDPSIRFSLPPFPHFLAYDNLVASCDGQTLNEEAKILPHHCCNNKRGNAYVEPLYFHEEIASELSYDSRGHIQCPEEFVEYLDERGINIMCRFLNDVRLFWKKIANSEYTKQQVLDAEEDMNLRLDIIDDVFTNDPTGHWLFLTEERAWGLFSDYSWFYTYYST